MVRHFCSSRCGGPKWQSTLDAERCWLARSKILLSTTKWSVNRLTLMFPIHSICVWVSCLKAWILNHLAQITQCPPSQQPREYRRDWSTSHQNQSLPPLFCSILGEGLRPHPGDRVNQAGTCTQGNVTFVKATLSQYPSPDATRCN